MEPARRKSTEEWCICMHPESNGYGHAPVCSVRAGRKKRDTVASMAYVIGMDFGTLSARAVLADTETGHVHARSVSTYASGIMDRFLPDGREAMPGTALQRPEDYLREAYLTELRALCVPSEDDFSYQRFDGPALDLGALAEAVDALPFFSERRMVEVRDYDINACREAE